MVYITDTVFVLRMDGTGHTVWSQISIDVMRINDEGTHANKLSVITPNTHGMEWIWLNLNCSSAETINTHTTVTDWYLSVHSDAAGLLRTLSDIQNVKYFYQYCIVCSRATDCLSIHCDILSQCCRGDLQRVMSRMQDSSQGNTSESPWTRST